MKQIKVIIDPNYGDSGKGHMTDYFASQIGGIVIRYSGGAQAGHTVQVKDRRHIFHHFGSGTIAGCPTYLAKEFRVNPLLFLQEWPDLADLKPKVYVHPDCLVTTPWDMLANQKKESSRTEKHGSCGVGIYETWARSQDPKAKITVLDLTYPPRLKAIVSYIMKYYWPFPEWQLYVDPFIKDCLSFLDKVEICDDSILDDYESLIFEGSQGLLLDKDWGSKVNGCKDGECSPYVTCGNTGMTNVMPILCKLDSIDLEIVYVTRWYMTRHGEGPFNSEILPKGTKPHNRVIDTTNVTNQWQGSLRYGWLDVNLLNKSIRNDMLLMGRKSLAVTCMDQSDGRYPYIKDGEFKISEAEEFLWKANPFLTAKYASWGPSREWIGGA